MSLETKCIKSIKVHKNEVILLRFIIFSLTIEIQEDMGVLLLKGKKKK